MDEQMTQARLIDTLRSKRAAWDAALAQVPEDRMTQPGAAGHWSVKDIVVHVTAYERWMAERMHEVLRGETYVPTALDQLHYEQRNDRIYELERDRPLAEVLAESQQVFPRLLEAVQAHTEEFLLQPQQFEGVPEPIVVWQMLRSEVYDHYGEHIPSILAWAASSRSPAA
jgi:uncharacterized protein (TIGR03083 family)